MNSVEFIKNSTNLTEKNINNTLQLLQEGATIPFIARYRKEMTGALDEVQIAQIRDAAKLFDDLIARQKTILTAIDEQGKLTDFLKEKITACFDSVILEDLYLPYKQKRLTRGDKAKKLGLEPLAKMIISQKGGDPMQMAERFVKGEVVDEEMALAGAADIIAEYMNENAVLRSKLRYLFQRKAVLASKVMKGKQAEAEKYKDYFDFSEPLYRVPSHRFLALYRGEREGLLSIKALPDKEEALEIMNRFFVKGNDACGDFVRDVCKDAYARLLSTSLENEVISLAKEKADKDAIGIFSKNLKQLLLAAPLGSKRILAIDPGFRTGCKVVCLDESGQLLTNATIYPHPPQNEKDKAMAKLNQLVQSYKIETIAIGDGTAGRETETLIRKTRFDRDLEVFVVREDGASIYSASSIARKEFPDYDVTVRGAVSIGRRLMDPLAELVKIDPKSIGVGQYQHEVNQSALKDALDDVVISAVNSVGVELNTASPYLLSYVSGLGMGLAENIVQFREENGAFTSRAELKKVKRLGDKAFEQAAGFLRIRNASNPLDNSSIHPESYPAVEKIAKKLNKDLTELVGNQGMLDTLTWNEDLGVDHYTFQDIIQELKKPGRDPRKQAKVLEFDQKIKTIDDLIVGMQLPGIVTNVTAFGAFVNIGIKENGLIHKSNLSDTYVEDPSQIIRLHEHVKVQVLEVDVPRKRVGLKKMD
jgi:protein Tex